MKSQHTRTGRTGSLRLSRTARAVRAALFATAIVASPVAFAQSCVQTATNEVTCTGVFTDDVINTVPLVNQVPGLSLIIDDATTVDPAAGINGLTAAWGGDVGVLSYAAINTDGADAIYVYGDLTATLATYGDLYTYVSAAGANAIDVSAFGDVDVTIGGSVVASSDGAYDVLTVDASSVDGSVTLLADGSAAIGAYAYDGDAIGVLANGYVNTYATIDGSVTAASTYGNAGGVIATADTGNAYLGNYGTISADAYAYANGAVAGAKYGNAGVYNAGDISATAYLGSALGVLGYAGGTLYAGNTGSISASSTYGAAGGLVAYAADDVTFYNAGSITANGYDLATAVALISTGGDVYADNYGDIGATASGDANVNALGLGATGYYVGIYNYGNISASATASNAAGYASATALYVDSNNASVDNAGSLYAYAYATGYGAYATGAELYADDFLSIANEGDIAAYAYGAGYGAVATGVYGTAVAGGITLVNTGSITATSDDVAVALDLYSNTYVDIYNYGTIAAYGDNYSIAIDTSGGASADYIYNAGTITGAIYTGAGDDVFFNAEGGTWNAVGYSDFGDGDDTVTNYGDIYLDDSGISLGGYATAAGNLFQNSGNIFNNGDSFIDVGAGAGASASLFVNDGTIDMQDGAADDTLTIYGDFAGTGNINLDVEGNPGVADMLYIEGDVAADADQTINVDIVDLSAPIADIIPMVEVSGTSTAANFSLGTVGFDPDNSFVDLDFSLIADIDATNATPDVFSLGIDVVGLTDTGTLAAAIAPSVHSLMQTEVGTWRQRQGIIDAFNDGTVSLWARVFHEKTDFDQDFVSDDIGPGGNFDWTQRNSGVEAGVDFAVSDGFAIGLLVAKSKADIDLDPGNADADIDADTWGIYGTWLSQNGFYLDASYRWTKFETDMDTPAGSFNIDDGKAETFNVEAGYAFTMASGLKIEPQLQWTHTNVKDLDVLTLDNGMFFSTDGADSSRGRLGVAVYKGMGDADTGWRVTPYVALSAVREFDGENEFAINDALFGRTERDGTSGLLELAVTARHRNLSIWGGVNWMDGGGVSESIGGQLGVRYTFGGAAPAPVPAPVPVAPVKTCADLDDDADGINNCDDKCAGSTAGQAVGTDGCPVPAPEPEPVMEPKPFRG